LVAARQHPGMSRIADLLALKRSAQIAALEGREAEPPSELDEKLELARREAAARAEQDDRRSRRRPPRRGLHFGPHAKRRMSQRGLTHTDVYHVWAYGTPHPSGDDLVFHMDRDAVTVAPDWIRARGLDGVAIVVAPPPDPGKRPSVRTVLADGENTRFTRSTRAPRRVRAPEFRQG